MKRIIRMERSTGDNKLYGIRHKWTLLNLLSWSRFVLPFVCEFSTAIYVFFCWKNYLLTSSLKKKLSWLGSQIYRLPSFTMHFSVFQTVLSAGLPMSEDYSSSKPSSAVSHQSLPAFSQPFGSRSSFRGYSPPFSSSQQNTTGTVAGAGVETASWTYATSTNDPMTTQYATPSRRQTVVNPVSAPTQHSAAASLTASE